MIPVLHGVWSAGGVAGDYEHIETITVGAGGAASVTFSSIAGTYKHLQVRYVARANAAVLGTLIRLNGNTGSNYAFHELYGNGTSALSSASTSQTFGLSYIAPSSAPASTFGAGIIDILDYTSTSKNKTVRSLAGYDGNGAGTVGLVSSLFFATPAAVTQIDLIAQSSNQFVQHSTFALYGVK